MAAKATAKEADLAVVVVRWWMDLAKEIRREALETPEGHAAEDETSEVLAAYPHLVKYIPKDADEWVEARFRAYGRSIYEAEYAKAVQGYPSRVGREKGKAVLAAAVDELVKLIEELRPGGPREKGLAPRRYRRHLDQHIAGKSGRLHRNSRRRPLLEELGIHLVELPEKRHICQKHEGHRDVK